MTITTSNDITVLQVKVTWDISGTSPAILLENLSQGPDLASCDWWFVALAPGEIPIHEGSEADPDISGTWTEFELNDNWPRAFNNILWSGAPYSFQVFVKDGDGNVFEGDVQQTTICRPSGNSKNSTNTFGLGTCDIQVKCAEGRVFFQDTTNATYQGLTGILGASVLRVYYPPDETGVIPDPFVGANFSTALVPITYSSDSYQCQAYSIYDYDMGDYVHIRVKYQTFNPVNGSPVLRFAVLCNINLCSLICEVDKLVMSLQTGNCANAQEAQQKLNLINPKLWMIVTGMQQPLCGIDVPAMIEEVKTIGGFDCNCCNAPTGIIPTGSSIIDGYNFEVVSECGDIDGEVVVNGNNIQIVLSDVTYTFAMCGGSPAETTAFSFQSALVGCNRQVCLNVDVTQLAFDILNTIKTDGDLVNLFNSIVVNNGGGEFTLLVDGKCIFSTSDSCDYTFTLSNIPVSTTFATMVGVKLAANDAITVLNFSFNLTNLPDLQSYLNGLGIGTFVVSNPSGQTVVITSANNTNEITSLKYAIAGSYYLAALSSDCTGYSPLSANQVVQNIIDYLCSLDDSQVVTSAEYEVCYIDSDGQKQIETVAAGTTLVEFFQTLTEKGCTTIDYIVSSQGGVTCDNIKANFPVSIATMQANDYFLGTKAAACSQISPVEAFLAMLSYGQYNSSVVDAFCKMVNLCGAGNICAPYDVFFAVVTPESPEPSPPGTADLVITFDHPGAASNIITYGRIDNTEAPVYTTITGILPGESPYTIANVPYGQYRVKIKPVYADGRLCSETVYVTEACEGITAFSVTYDGSDIVATYTAAAGTPYVKLNLSYPNGGSFSQIYAVNDPNPITVTPPTDVYGTFYATLQPVCDNDSGWFGEATAQVSFEIPIPYTVVVQVEDPLGGSSNKITSVTGITGFTLPSEVTEGNYKGGYHDAFTGAITVNIVQPISVSNGLRLYINDAEIECVSVNTASPFSVPYAFASQTYAATDVIRIVYMSTDCDVSP